MKALFEFLGENPDYIISVFVLIFAVLGMQFKDMRIILISQVIANGLLGIQCIIAGTASTGGVVFLGTLQTALSFVFAHKKKRFPTWLTVLFILGYTSITVFGFFSPNVTSSPWDLLTMVAAWFFAVSMVQEKSWICRIYSVANLLLWITYEIILMPSGLITHCIILPCTIVGIIRNDRAEWKALIKNLKILLHNVRAKWKALLGKIFAKGAKKDAEEK